MNRAEFEDFIKRQQVNANKPPAPFDPARQLREWHEHLSKLYGIVEQFMKPYAESASASLSYEDIQLNEEFSGPYTARQLSLTMANQRSYSNQSARCLSAPRAEWTCEDREEPRDSGLSTGSSTTRVK